MNTEQKIRQSKRTRENTCRLGAKIARQGGHCTTRSGAPCAGNTTGLVPADGEG